METKEKRDVYQIVTDRIIELMENGTVPWQQPWTDAGIPMNAVTKRPYQGFNLFFLAAFGFERNLFLTYKQVQDAGGKVIKGSKSLPITYWNWKEIGEEDPETGEKKKKAYLRYYSVFNIEQCDDLPEDIVPPVELKDNDPIQVCDEIIAGMPDAPKIFHQQQAAFYAPKADYINMPKMETFENSEAYYSVLFHELVHSTGHEKRLNRPEISKRNSCNIEACSLEELVAEIGSCFLRSVAGITTLDFKNSASYLEGWLSVFQNDKRMLLSAASQAQKAVDHIMVIHSEKEAVPADEVVAEDPF